MVQPCKPSASQKRRLFVSDFVLSAHMLRLARKLTRRTWWSPAMNPTYLLSDPSGVFTPALLFYKDVIRRNLAAAIAIAVAPERLRPHVKTHKTREIVRMGLEARISKH